MENYRYGVTFFMYLYLVMNVNRRVRQGEWPDGQEKVPWGVPLQDT